MRCVPAVLYTAKSMADDSPRASHCDTCKCLGGGAYSLNQVVPKSALNLTKGNLKEYTYYGDSGKNFHNYDEHDMLLLRR
jgi:hypothetical protein